MNDPTWGASMNRSLEAVWESESGNDATELAHLMRACGLTQSSLARTINVNRGSVRRWLIGETPVPKAVLLWLRLVDRVRKLPECT